MLQSVIMGVPSRSRRPPLGQHFLASERVVQRIREVLKPQEGDCWLEIGPGHGEVTKHLASGSKLVVAIERDAELAAGLQTSRPGSTLQVLTKDILAVSLTMLAGRYEVKAWRVYGSLPYYITSPILHRLFHDIDSVQDVHIIVQKEVAERIVAEPGSRDYGYLSVAAQVHARAELLFKLAPGEFRPPPQVDSALVRLTPREEGGGVLTMERAAFLTFVQTCFRQKRKTLRNNLVGRFDADSIRTAIKEEGLAPLCRAEELPIPTLAAIFRRVTPLR